MSAYAGTHTFSNRCADIVSNCVANSCSAYQAAHSLSDLRSSHQLSIFHAQFCANAYTYSLTHSDSNSRPYSIKIKMAFSRRG